MDQLHSWLPRGGRDTHVDHRRPTDLSPSPSRSSRPSFHQVAIGFSMHVCRNEHYCWEFNVWEVERARGSGSIRAETCWHRSQFRQAGGSRLDESILIGRVLLDQIFVCNDPPASFSRGPLLDASHRNRQVGVPCRLLEDFLPMHGTRLPGPVSPVQPPISCRTHCAGPPQNTPARTT